MKSSVSVDKAAVEEFISGCNVLSADVYLVRDIFLQFIPSTSLL
jgi:CTP:phosphocholine cytidylyltransferase-like protein